MRLALAAVALVIAVGPACADDPTFSCAMFKQDFNASLSGENPAIPVLFEMSDANFPAVRQIDLKSDILLSSYVWCSKINDSVRALSLSFRVLDIALPSKSEKAQAMLADAVCTMTQSEMTDCDAVINITTKALEDGGVGHIGLNNDWDLYFKNKDGVLNYDFEATKEIVHPRKEIHLSIRSP